MSNSTPPLVCGGRNRKSWDSVNCNASFHAHAVSAPSIVTEFEHGVALMGRQALAVGATGLLNGALALQLDPPTLLGALYAASLLLAVAMVALAGFAYSSPQRLSRAQEKQLRGLKGCRLGGYSVLAACQLVVAGYRVLAQGMHPPTLSELAQLQALLAWLAVWVSG